MTSTIISQLRRIKDPVLRKKLLDYLAKCPADTTFRYASSPRDALAETYRYAYEWLSVWDKENFATVYHHWAFSQSMDAEISSDELPLELSSHGILAAKQSVLSSDHRLAHNLFAGVPA